MTDINDTRSAGTGSSSSSAKANANKSKSIVALLFIIGIALIALILIVVYRAHKANNTTAAVVPIKVQITSSGFNPATVILIKGSTVEWVNSDTLPHRVAANPFPTHTDLPSLDSMTNILPGGSYSYQFNQVGTFGYHDELHPTVNGSVTVK